MSAMNAIRRSLSSCLERTRMWRRTERASFEKKPSMRLSHDPWVGVNVKVKRPIGCAASQFVVSRVGGMVVEDELDRGVGGVSGIEEFEKFNEFAAAVTFPDEGVDVASEQTDPGHQGQGAVTLYS